METSTSISGADLKALARCAAPDDVRYYLRGVCFEPSGHAVATNGHYLLAVRVPEFSGAPFIVPIDVINAALKRKGAARYTFVVSGAQFPEKSTIDGREFVPIDGKFPDWRRVIPLALSGESANYDPSYLVHFQRVVADIESGKPAREQSSAPINVCLNGGGPGIIRHKVLDAKKYLAILMPRYWTYPDSDELAETIAAADDFIGRAHAGADEKPKSKKGKRVAAA